MSLANKYPCTLVKKKKKTAPFYPVVLEDETHLLFHCPVNSAIRQKYIAEFTDQEVLPLLKTLLEAPSTVVSRKVAMVTSYALKRRKERLV